MPNPENVSKTPVVVSVNTAGVTLRLDPQRDYLLFHDGIDENGDTAADTVFCAGDIAGDQVPNTPEAGDNRFRLLAARSVVIPPGYTALGLRAAAGSTTTPTVSVMPGPSYLGRF